MLYAEINIVRQTLYKLECITIVVCGSANRWPEYRLEKYDLLAPYEKQWNAVGLHGSFYWHHLCSAMPTQYSATLT